MMNDFLTDDFVNKNIRVRPSSGKTLDEGKDMKSHGSRAHINQDQDEINEEIVFKNEFSDQRDAAKEVSKQKREEALARERKRQKELAKK